MNFLTCVSGWLLLNIKVVACTQVLLANRYFNQGIVPPKKKEVGYLATCNLLNKPML